MPVWAISGCGIVGAQLVVLIKVVTSGFTERLALGWVQKYICEFGGDPTKVTM